MARISIYQDFRRGGDGKYPLYYRVSLPGARQFIISSGIKIAAENWKDGRVVGIPQAGIIERKLLDTASRLEDAVLELQLSGGLERPLDEVRSLIRSAMNSDCIYRGKQTFSQFYENYLRDIDSDSTRSIYRHTLGRIRSHDSRELRFSDITPAWLCDLEKELKRSGVSVNGINLHMRNIRAVFNAAARKDKALKSLYPFDDYKLRSEPTAHRDLCVEELRIIRDFDGDPDIRHYLDIFMLIFYMGGINIGDLCLLKKSDIHNGRVEYRRQKTGAFISLKLQPEAEEIINRYASRGDWLLEIMDTRQDYHSYLHQMNKALKSFGPVEIGKYGKKLRSPLFPRLSTYYTRHTFATLAGEVGYSNDVIGAVLGHANKTVTGIYVNIPKRKMDEVVRKVIDYVNADLGRNNFK